MMSISSKAGRRLAVARARFLALRELGQYSTSDYIEACEEMDAAADEVADELIDQRFHEYEGD